MRYNVSLHKMNNKTISHTCFSVPDVPLPILISRWEAIDASVGWKMNTLVTLSKMKKNYHHTQSYLIYYYELYWCELDINERVIIYLFDCVSKWNLSLYCIGVIIDNQFQTSLHISKWRYIIKEFKMKNIME